MYIIPIYSKAGFCYLILWGEFDMAPTDAQKRATAKWHKEKVEDIKFRVPMGEKAVIKAHADQQGESVNAFLLRAARETMARDREQS